MTHDPNDFDHDKSPWFLGATTFESKVGDWMRANFALADDQLPHEMADLIGRLRDRETAAPGNARGGRRVRG